MPSVSVPSVTGLFTPTFGLAMVPTPLSVRSCPPIKPPRVKRL